MKRNFGQTEQVVASLFEYAELIAKSETRKNTLASLIQSYKEAQSQIELDAELTAAFDPELTNSDKRRAAKRDILASNLTYQSSSLKLKQTEAEYLTSCCEYDRLRRLFRAVELDKLEKLKQSC